MSNERAAIIDGVAGVTAGKALGDNANFIDAIATPQFLEELGGRAKTAAAAAGQAYSAVGTGVLDLATAAHAAFGADPKEAWTHDFAQGVRQFYNEAQDDRFRDAVATKLTSGLASAHSFMAPGGVVRWAGGGAKALTITAGITGAIQNGGAAYAAGPARVHLHRKAGGYCAKPSAWLHLEAQAGTGSSGGWEG